MVVNFGTYEELPLAYYPYDDHAASLGAELVRFLCEHISDASIEHVGSTAVPGLGGKNSVNILIAAKANGFPTVLATLESLGLSEYPTKIEPEDRPVRVGMIDGPARKYPIHVKVVEDGSANHYDSIFMREYLLRNPEVAERYATAKQQLVASGADEEAYGIAKQPVILDIILRRPTGWERPGDPLV